MQSLFQIWLNTGQIRSEHTLVETRELYTELDRTGQDDNCSLQCCLEDVVLSGFMEKEEIQQEREDIPESMLLPYKEGQIRAVVGNVLEHRDSTCLLPTSLVEAPLNQCHLSSWPGKL